MTMYLIIFLIVTAILYFKDNYKDKKKIFYLEITALLILCLFAALRDTSIGTDIKVYVVQLFNKAKESKNIIDYYKSSIINNAGFIKVSSYEYGFTFFTYIISNVFRNISILLFFIHAIIIIPIYYGSKKIIKNNKYHTVFFLLFLLTMFNFSLNGIRQSMGIAISFYGFSLVYNCDNKENNIKFLISVILSMLFHLTSIMILIPYAYFKLLKSDKKIYEYKKIKVNFSTLIILAVMSVLTLLFIEGHIIRSVLNLLKLSKYSLYLEGNISLKLTVIIRTIPIFIILYYLFNVIRKETKINKTYNFYILLELTYILLLILSSRTTYAIRIISLFDLFNCFIIMKIIESLKEDRKYYIVISALYYYILWLIFYAYLNSSHTIPYRFIF